MNNQWKPEERALFQKIARGTVNVLIGVGRTIKNGESDSSNALIDNGITDALDGLEQLENLP